MPEPMHSPLYLQWVKERKIIGLTRTQHEFAEWLLENPEMVLRIGGFLEVFQSLCMWIKRNRELF